MKLDRDLLFKAAADGVLPLVSRCSITVEKSEDSRGTSDEARTPVIASTATPDRYGDIVDQNGWILDNFVANPVIQPFHNYATPSVGRGENVKIIDHASGPALAMDIVWDMGLELGRTLHRQYTEGFARGVSVGFRPIDYTPRSELDESDPRFGSKGMVIHKAELLELSTAPVPVQQEALAAKAFGDPYRPDGILTPSDVMDLITNALETSQPAAMTSDNVIDMIVEALETNTKMRMAVTALFAAHKLTNPEPRKGIDALADWLGSME